MAKSCDVSRSMTKHLQRTPLDPSRLWSHLVTSDIDGTLHQVLPSLSHVSACIDWLFVAMWLTWSKGTLCVIHLHRHGDFATVKYTTYISSQNGTVLVESRETMWSGCFASRSSIASRNKRGNEARQRHSWRQCICYSLIRFRSRQRDSLVHGRLCGSLSLNEY